MSRILLLILPYLLSVKLSIAQTRTLSPSDLEGAKIILVNTSSSFTDTPSGFGNIQEFPVNPHRPPAIFKEERNTSWFRINIPFNGNFTFELSAHSLNDDYDWMVFKDDASLGPDLKNGTAMPVRSNNSRNDKNLNSKTGMKDGFTANFVIPGPGSSYSGPLQVRKGDQLVLVIDNIYKNGKGFDLKVELKPSFILSGSIGGYVKARKTGEPLEADIYLEDDSTGSLVSQTRSDPGTGKYSLAAPLNLPLTITANNSRYLFSGTGITLDSVKNRVDFNLDTLQAGNKLILFNIRFQANKDDILPSSKPDIDRLITFMKTHVLWNVRIVGHTNNNVFADSRYLQQLSFDRAIRVKRILVQNAVSEKRISCAGVGGKNPMINTKDPVLVMKNLRVEVILTGK